MMMIMVRALDSRVRVGYGDGIMVRALDSRVRVGYGGGIMVRALDSRVRVSYGGLGSGRWTGDSLKMSRIRLPAVSQLPLQVTTVGRLFA